MIKVNIYPIVSSLHVKDTLEEQTRILISSLSSDEIKINITFDIDKLYSGCDLSLILVQSGGSEGQFLKLKDKLKGPYYLLTYGTNNSLAASLEILAYLNNNNLEGEVLHGDTSYLKERILLLSEKQKDRKENASISRLGIIGTPSDWLISSSVNKESAKYKFDIDLIDIDIKEVIDGFNEEYPKILNSEGFEEYSKFEAFWKKELNKARVLEKVLDDIVVRHNLNGFTLRCFDLLNTIKTTSCLAFGFLNNSETVATCEGDVPSMIGMHLVRKLFNLNSFQCNPSLIDVNKNEITLAHCTVPFSMCESYKYDTHFESGIGIGIKGELKDDSDVTIFRLNSSLTKYFVEEAKIIHNEDDKNRCRTQIVLRCNNLNKLLTTSLGNHEIVFYGKHKKQLSEYLNKCGLTEI